jgi:hypothetical protein
MILHVIGALAAALLVKSSSYLKPVPKEHFSTAS